MTAERLRDRSPPTVSTVGFSAQEFAAGSAASLCTSGGTGGPPNFTKLTGRDLTAETYPAEGELLSPSNGASASSPCDLQFAQPGRPVRDGVSDVPLSATEMREGVASAMWTDLQLFCRAIGNVGDARERLAQLSEASGSWGGWVGNVDR